MDPELKRNLTAGATWRRGLFMVLFTLFYSVAEIVLAAVVIYQFVSAVFTGGVNVRLQTFGQALASYIYQVVQYLCFNSEERPYPFAPWPGESGAAEVKSEAFPTEDDSSDAQ